MKQKGRCVRSCGISFVPYTPGNKGKPFNQVWFRQTCDSSPQVSEVHEAHGEVISEEFFFPPDLFEYLAAPQGMNRVFDFLIAPFT